MSNHINGSGANSTANNVNASGADSMDKMNECSECGLSMMTCVGLGAFAILLLVIIVTTFWVYIRTCKLPVSSLRGLLLPNGTIRSILALLIVGSYIIFTIFGYSFIFDIYKSSNASIDVGAITTIYQTIITAFTGLSAAVIGFYFGARAATPSPALLGQAISENSNNNN